MKYLQRRRLTYFIAATPALAFFLFQVWPLGYAAVSALTDAAGRPTLAHFAEVYGQPIFRRAAINNLVIPIAGVALVLQQVNRRSRSEDDVWLPGEQQPDRVVIQELDVGGVNKGLLAVLDAAHHDAAGAGFRGTVGNGG